MIVRTEKPKRHFVPGRARGSFAVLALALLPVLWSESCHAVIGGERMKSSMMMTRYVVAITYTNEKGEFKSCTGGIIAPQMILTAAHCVPKDISSMRVIFGDTLFRVVAGAVH